MSQDPWTRWRDETLAARHQADLMRVTQPVHARDAVHVEDDDGRVMTLFSGNDYLGLSHHPEVREAMARACQDRGAGPRGSALVCGYTGRHALLERRLADLKGQQDALLCPTGYAANMAALSALAGPDVTLFSDALNHASIIDGLRLGRRKGAHLEVYRHNDTDHLAELLANTPRHRRKLIVTDAVFSMDGDLAPLAELARLKREHDALLVVDEAHATLVFGDHGGGLAEHVGLADQIDLHVGTLSKAFGMQGGYVATSHAWRDVLVNHGRTFIYSTALPSPVVEGALAALDLTRRDPNLRTRLWGHVEAASLALNLPLTSPIIPILLGDAQRTLDVAAGMIDAGFHIIAIRPPTVPRGTARLRITLSAAHSAAEVNAMCRTLRALM